MSSSSPPRTYLSRTRLPRLPPSSPPMPFPANSLEDPFPEQAIVDYMSSNDNEVEVEVEGIDVDVDADGGESDVEIARHAMTPTAPLFKPYTPVRPPPSPTIRRNASSGRRGGWLAFLVSTSSEIGDDEAEDEDEGQRFCTLSPTPSNDGDTEDGDEGDGTHTPTPVGRRSPPSPYPVRASPSTLTMTPARAQPQSQPRAQVVTSASTPTSTSASAFSKTSISPRPSPGSAPAPSSLPTNWWGASVQPTISPAFIRHVSAPQLYSYGRDPPPSTSTSASSSTSAPPAPPQSPSEVAGQGLSPLGYSSHFPAVPYVRYDMFYQKPYTDVPAPPSASSSRTNALGLVFDDSDTEMENSSDVGEPRSSSFHRRWSGSSSPDRSSDRSSPERSSPSSTNGASERGSKASSRTTVSYLRTENSSPAQEPELEMETEPALPSPLTSLSPSAAPSEVPLPLDLSEEELTPGPSPTSTVSALADTPLPSAMTSPAQRRTFKIGLWETINDPMFDEFIRWSDDGLFGVVPDKQEFVGSPAMRAICDASNIGGFVRQLHMWGFTRFRVGDSEGSLGFRHERFQRGHVDLLEDMCRKGESKTLTTRPETKKRKAKVGAKPDAKKAAPKAKAAPKLEPAPKLASTTSPRTRAQTEKTAKKAAAMAPVSLGPRRWSTRISRTKVNYAEEGNMDASPGSSAQFSNTTPESNPNTDRDSAMEALYHRNSMLEQENAELLANKTENDVIKLKLAELRARMTEAVFRNFGDEATEAAPLPAKRAGSSTPGPSAHDVQIPEERPMKRRSTRTRRTAA